MLATFSLKEDYWDNFELQEEDLEFLSQYLLEVETPLSPEELVEVLVKDRLRREKEALEEQRRAGGERYYPKERYKPGDKLVFSALDWQAGEVDSVRPAQTYAENSFDVIKVKFEDGEMREFAAGLEEHILNEPTEIDEDDPQHSAQGVLENYGPQLINRLIADLKENPDFVYIAGRWFPRALLVEVNEGNLNLAEAVLDMAGGGPLPTSELLGDVELPEGVNQKLAEFSLDLAMQEDDRFDEVGPAGEVLWFLRRLEPEGVREKPLFLRYRPIDYDRSALTEEMLALEQQLDDELSPLEEGFPKNDKVEVNLIYPHWRAGTLPLTPKLSKLFPTAYEAPHIRFMLIDGQTEEHFPGWVVRFDRYVFGLREWYLENGLIPGSKVWVRRGENPGEVIIEAGSQRSKKEWVRTALIGADGGVVYAMLKQALSTAFDDRMVIAMPTDVDALDAAWKRTGKDAPPFEQLVADTLRELAKLNPQNHVHATELYTAVNVLLRCPPGPLLSLLASRPWFVHVGDLHFRFEGTEGE